MTVSIANMTSVWMSNSNVYNAISMSVSTMGYGANSISRVLTFSVDANTVFDVDTKGIFFSKANTVSSLPAASSVAKGSRSFVTDCSNSVFNVVVASGGSNSVPVFSDGTNWRIG